MVGGPLEQDGPMLCAAAHAGGRVRRAGEPLSLWSRSFQTPLRTLTSLLSGVGLDWPESGSGPSRPFIFGLSLPGTRALRFLTLSYYVCTFSGTQGANRSRGGSVVFFKTLRVTLTFGNPGRPSSALPCSSPDTFQSVGLIQEVTRFPTPAATLQGSPDRLARAPPLT